MIYKILKFTLEELHKKPQIPAVAEISKFYCIGIGIFVKIHQVVYVGAVCMMMMIQNLLPNATACSTVGFEKMGDIDIRLGSSTLVVVYGGCDKPRSMMLLNAYYVYCIFDIETGESYLIRGPASLSIDKVSHQSFSGV